MEKDVKKAMPSDFRGESPSARRRRRGSRSRGRNVGGTARRPRARTAGLIRLPTVRQPVPSQPIPGRG